MTIDEARRITARLYPGCKTKAAAAVPASSGTQPSGPGSFSARPQTPSRDGDVWVDDRTCVPNGGRVVVLQADASSGFSLVQASNGTSGYIRSEYLTPE